MDKPTPADVNAPKPRPNRLPGEILNQLDPRLLELYSQLPPGQSSAIAKLVTQALPVRVRPDLLLKYAFLFNFGIRQFEGEAVSIEHTRRSKAELVGQIHGLREGYINEEKAVRTYRGGRRASQSIEASLSSVLERLKSSERVIRKYRGKLPVHQQSRLSDERIVQVRELLIDMQRAAMVDQHDFLVEENRSRPGSRASCVYVLWRLGMAQYRGNWNDMHQLAMIWRLTKAKDVETFRTMVNQACKGLKRGKLGTTWDSVLSRKS